MQEGKSKTCVYFEVDAAIADLETLAPMRIVLRRKRGCSDRIEGERNKSAIVS